MLNFKMRKFLSILFFGIFISGCAINQTALNLGTNYSTYAKECKKVSLAQPKLVSADGNVKVYTCPDGSQYQSNRYEVFENNKLVKVFTRQWTAAEKQANLNQMLLGLSLLSGGTGTTTTTQSQQPPGFLEFETISGMNKICFYNQVGSLNTKTIGAAELCPLQY